MENSSANILIVDDEAVTCTILETVLERAGYKTMISNNGEQALRSVRDEAPDLVLLDVMLPDISGYDVYKKIKEDPANHSLPVIFVTSLDEDSVLNYCDEIREGVDYILKPLRADILLARVANVINVVKIQKQLVRQNEKLKEEIIQKNRLSAVIEQFSDSVLIVDSYGSISYANKACEENSGFSVEELIGKNIWDIQQVTVDAENTHAMLELILAGGEWQGTIPNRKKNGSLYMEDISILPLHKEDGKDSCHVMIKKDVTEKRRLESIASSVNLMDNVGFVFSGIRHELGNPINSLKMTLSVLGKKINDFPEETVKDFLDRSLHEVGRIEYLLKSLRSFSMFELPVPAEIKLQDFLKNLVAMHRKDLDRNRVQLMLEVSDNADTVFADDRALLQVMLNLLTNAANALEGRPEPRITIRAKKESSKLVCLSLEDNGCGISEKNQEMLFKPFFTTRAEGTGLGLVIVKKMLAQMDCSIHVSSTEDVGTVISILLPTSEVVRD